MSSKHDVEVAEQMFKLWIGLGIAFVVGLIVVAVLALFGIINLPI